ncbi:lipoLppI domain protein [Mycobacterium xenopi 4042]|uniref:LipoLppI domain protein n=2 Tax=Mycobacterium xenopi TaxID=1789 RepID=X8BGC0_MYCXE|nr:lipoLppI domain protein [Mycobacterium xenopi 4042]
MFCVNYAHRSAVRLAAAGIEPFGCLQPVPPPEGVGEKFSC